MKYLFALLLAAPVYACKCEGVPNAVKSLNRSDVAFVGKLVQKGPGEASYKVEESFKNAADIMKIRFGGVGTSCQANIPDRAVLWAEKRADGLWITACTIRDADVYTELVQSFRAARGR
jgi:hypothetical protein